MTAPKAWFAAESVTKAFDGVTALRDFTLTVAKGELVALVGPNGAGKSTFFDIVSGVLAPDCGRVSFRGIDLLRITMRERARIGIMRTFQELRLFERLSVLDNVTLCFPDQPGESLSGLFSQPLRAHAREATLRREALRVLEGVGLDKAAAQPAGDLSYGQQKLTCLACCLAANADLVLLDEPIAGISPSMVEVILATLSSLKADGRSAIVIEHDLDLLESICDRMVFMEAGTRIAAGTPADVRADPRVLMAYFGAGT